jgi:hypothetical protein
MLEFDSLNMTKDEINGSLEKSGYKFVISAAFIQRSIIIASISYY